MFYIHKRNQNILYVLNIKGRAHSIILFTFSKFLFIFKSILNICSRFFNITRVPYVDQSVRIVCHGHFTTFLL